MRVAKRFFRAPDRVGIATVDGFADALGGGAHIGGLPGPLLLVSRDSLSAPVESYLREQAAAIVFTYGGTAVISDATAAGAASVVGSVEGFAPRLARTPFAYAQGGGVENPVVGEWPITDERWFLPGTGTLRALMLFVDFPDARATETTQAMFDHFAPLPEAWYAEASYGRLTLDLAAQHTWYRMSQPVASYGVQRCCAHQPVADFFAEATSLADGQVDFSRYDAVWVFGPNTAGDLAPALPALPRRRCDARRT